MEPDVRYCTTDDGVRIAYCVAGEGPDIVCCPDAVGSFALDHLIEDQMGFWRALWGNRRVIRFDMRGTGLSDRDVDDVSHEALVRDLTAVARASGASNFTLWASTMSGPRAIAYAVRRDADVRRLILHRTFARARDVISEEQLGNFAQLARVNWKMAAQVFADLPVRRELPEAGVHQAELYVESTTGEFVARFLTSGFETTDVTALLSELTVPTLVLHRNNDPMFPFRVAQDLAAKIPNAHFRPLAQGIMTYLAAGRIDEVMSIINDFINDGAAPSAPRPAAPIDPTVRIVLFTDMVDHTLMMRRLGDEAGRAVLREHERITREMLRQHGGAEVKTDGDSFMASFTSPTKAVECAVALQQAFAAHNGAVAEPILIRAGLNIGEPIEENGDYFGSSVILAARIKDQASGGEILVPEALRHMLSGKKFVYADRGEVLLKGFGDPVRLYEVHWRE